MKLCGHCQRHLLDDASACPFCRQRVRFVGGSVVLGVALGLAPASCTSKDGGDTGGGTDVEGEDG